MFFLLFLLSMNMFHSLLQTHPQQQQQREVVSAKLRVHSADNLFDIEGIVINKTLTYQSEYSYLLFVLKKGSEGNYSKNSQSGEFSLAPEEKKSLATLKINVDKGENCKAYLFIRKNDVLVVKDSVSIDLKDKELGESDRGIDESEIGIKGLVVEDTKTKPGRDFYEYYYQDYLSSQMQFPFIVRIEEKPGRGLSSQISVIVEDQILYKFITNPSDEYIQMNAKKAFGYTYDYYVKRAFLFLSNKNKKY